METLTIDKKKFVIIEQSAFDKLQLLAAQKTAPAKKLSQCWRKVLSSIFQSKKSSLAQASACAL